MGAWARASSLAVLAAMGIAVGWPGDARAQLTWKGVTRSPTPSVPADANDGALYGLCGAVDGALVEVARANAARQAAGQAAMSADEIGVVLRAGGGPSVWPRAITIAGRGLGETEIASRVTGWVAPWNTLGTRRCGIGRAHAADGRDVVAVTAIDALADLAPLPMRVHVGQWVTLEATMLVPASGARVILLGPRGTPKSVVASLAGGKVHSSFTLDRPGEWLVQVLASVSTGPRPVLEASMFADATPPAQFAPMAAPGEDAGSGAPDEASALFAMLNAARASEGLTALTRDPALDQLAKEHATDMLRARLVGHDVGSGDPRTRLDAAGVAIPHVAGENAALSMSVAGAHRTLWASPSHRGNLLEGAFRTVGVGVVRGADGSVWVAELFVG